MVNGANDHPLGPVGSLNGKPGRQSRNVQPQKPMTMWDMMSLHDVNKYKKEADADSIRKQEAKRQLRSFLDQQVSLKQKERSSEKQKKEEEHQHLVSKLKIFDEIEGLKKQNTLITLQEQNAFHDQVIRERQMRKALVRGEKQQEGEQLRKQIQSYVSMEKNQSKQKAEKAKDEIKSYIAQHQRLKKIEQELEKES